MSLRSRIEADLKTAMREKDALARDTLRMALAALKNKAIELARELEPAEEAAVVTKAVKSRIDSAEQYDGAGRPELASKERQEAELLGSYLPRKLSEDETRELVARYVAELGLSGKADLSKLMKAVMAKHRSEVDGKLVQSVAGELLA